MISEVFKGLNLASILKDLWPFILIAVLLFLAGAVKAAASKDKKTKPDYAAVPLLTANESAAFKKLLAFCVEHDLLVFAKVRLIDLLEPKKGAAEYTALKNKVIQKHVDFVICDKDVNIKLILELDDSSHSRPDRQERDQFVDEALHSAGYEVIHTKAIIPEQLTKALFPEENKDKE